MATSLALISPDAGFAARVRLAAPDLAGDGLRRWRQEYTRIDPTKVVDEMVRDGVAVVCLGPGLDHDPLLALAAAFDRESPNVCVVVVAEPGPALWPEALRAGVRDVLSPEAGTDELARALARAAETAERRAQAAGRDPAAAPRSRVITVLSPKGGVGKTTVATNLAVGLAGTMPGQVAIVDLDVQFGDVAAALQLSPDRTLGDVAACTDDVTATMLKVFLAGHTSGLYALCAPGSPAEGDAVTAQHGARAVDLLAGEFATVVVDTAAGLQEHTLAAIERATDLVLVCSTDVASVQSLRKELDALDTLGMTGARRHFVLNRSDAKVGLDPADIEEAVGMRATLRLPSSRLVPVSTNVGVPVIESEPRAPVARHLARLVEQFTVRPDPPAAPDEAPAPAGRWRRAR